MPGRMETMRSAMAPPCGGQHIPLGIGLFPDSYPMLALTSLLGTQWQRPSGVAIDSLVGA
jgi:hypothetical protein